jgi:hypothetical protein
METAMTIRRAKSVVAVLAFAVALAIAGSGDAPAAVIDSSVTIPISGVVDGGTESVSLSGRLVIVSTLVTDATLASPKVRLAFSIVGVSGAGLTSGTKYIATGEDRLIRRLTLSDHVDLVFPFYRTGDWPKSARSAMASITLGFDVATGSITRATATISSPKLPG